VFLTAQNFASTFFEHKFLNNPFSAKTGALRVCWKKIFPVRLRSRGFFFRKVLS
jgi:hypothetical protein